MEISKIWNLAACRCLLLKITEYRTDYKEGGWNIIRQKGKTCGHHEN